MCPILEHIENVDVLGKNSAWNGDLAINGQKYLLMNSTMMSGFSNTFVESN